MPSCRVLHIDAFSDKANQGNPAGVVLDARGLSGEAMRQIAKAVGFNETVFVLPSEKADYRFRFFTPGHEMNLCGHATVAAAAQLGRAAGRSKSFTMETLAGGASGVLRRRERDGGVDFRGVRSRRGNGGGVYGVSLSAALNAPSISWALA